MVHPVVFEYVGYDPNQVTGFAFGMGIERVALLKWDGLATSATTHSLHLDQPRRAHHIDLSLRAAYVLRLTACGAF